MPNTLSDAEKHSQQRQSPRPDFRSRITLKMKSDVVELYQSGLSALGVAERCGIGKATVLKILRQEGAAIRPQGRRLT